MSPVLYITPVILYNEEWGRGNNSWVELSHTPEGTFENEHVLERWSTSESSPP